MATVTKADSANNWLDAVELIGEPRYARVSQFALEVIKQPTDQSARISQFALEVIKQPADQNARVSQFVLEVIYSIWQFEAGGESLDSWADAALTELLAAELDYPEDHSDSLDSWSDEIAQEFIELLDKVRNDSIDYWNDEVEAGFVELYVEVADGGVGPSDMEATIPLWESVADSFTLVDAATVYYGIFALAYTRSVADSFSEKRGNKSGTHLMKDGLQVETDDFQGLFVAIDDLEYFFDDTVEVSLVEYIIPLSDSPVPENLNNWSDAVVVRSINSVGKVDSFFLTDAIGLLLNVRVETADSGELADELAPSAWLPLEVSDDLANLLDAVGSSSDIDETASIEDDLSLEDEVLIAEGDSLTSYLRRYLNDVVRR